MASRKMSPSIKFLFISFLLVLPLTIHAAESSQGASPNQAKSIIDSMIQKMRGHRNISEYQMTISRPKWTRTIKMKIWDDRMQKRVFVRILEPAKEQGTSFLRLGYNLWNYIPAVEKVMKIPPSMMLQPWMGSDFTNDDLVKESSYSDDYEHRLEDTQELRSKGLRSIYLTPKPEAPVVWGQVIFWVRASDDLPVEQHFLDEKGRLIKDLIFSDYKTKDGVLLPTHWEMKPVTKEGQKTVMNLLSVDFDPVPPISEETFTEKNLRP